jgi:3-carboxy-cis,cis-muconate cycloisomerase
MSMSNGSDRLFSGLFACGGAATAVGDRALLAAMLDVEAALARGLASVGLIPSEAALTIAAAAADPDAFDLAELGAGSGESGTPVPAIVAALRARAGDAGEYVHVGATSQDIIDTGVMLASRRGLGFLLADLWGAGEECAKLATEHHSTVEIGRTLLQHAVPVTFGLKAAQWLSGLDAALAGLVQARDRDLAVSLGGAAGTLAAFEGHGFALGRFLAEELGLAPAELPWHAVRVRPARFASALGIALGAMAKVARDVILLAQTEVAEVRAGAGGSSAMPHKQNPVAAVAVVACADRAPGLVAAVLGSMAQEHERAAGGWQSEWRPVLELVALGGSAAASLRQLLEGLEVDIERMRHNVGLTGGLAMSESVVVALAPAVGFGRARELVGGAAREAAGAGSFRDALLSLPDVAAALPGEQLDQALAPEHYLGAADALIERALAAHRALAVEQR